MFEMNKIQAPRHTARLVAHRPREASSCPPGRRAFQARTGVKPTSCPSCHWLWGRGSSSKLQMTGAKSACPVRNLGARGMRLAGKRHGRCVTASRAGRSGEAAVRTSKMCRDLRPLGHPRLSREPVSWEDGEILSGSLGARRSARESGKTRPGKTGASHVSDSRVSPVDRRR